MMADVSVIGLGSTKTGELWDVSIRDLATEALLDAMEDAGVEDVDAILVGNMLSGELAQQENLGVLVADRAGLSGVEAVKVEAACASGAAAIRLGRSLIMAGEHRTVAVLGVEKMTDCTGDKATGALATAADADYESLHGVTFTALTALLMRAYMEKYGYERRDFANFSINAHLNARGNPKAMLRRAITVDDYLNAPLVATPITVMDTAPICDGAAAVILTASNNRPASDKPHVKILGTGAATDSMCLSTRKDPLWLDAAFKSATRAYSMADLTPDDIDVFEVHDAFPIISTLSLEASGFARPGEGVMMAKCGRISLEGDLPLQTMGGLKARGHPIGATGVYQAVEACLQIRGEAGENQVPGARIAMAQNVGGSASCIITHIFGRED